MFRRITIKTPAELDKMREAGRIVAQALALIAEMVKPGVTTKELDNAVEALIIKAGGTPLFKNYPSAQRGAKPFPASICASINEQVVHGIPNDRELKDGDIVSVDIGVRLDGWCGDAAKTYPVGQVGRKAQKLLDVTKASLDKGIEAAKAGNKLFQVSAAVQKMAESNGFSVVRQFVGHGIGRDMHEEPQIPNYVPKRGELLDGDDLSCELKPGMVLAIEPMVNVGTFDVLLDRSNGWTVFTKDRSLSAHFEHSVAVTEDGPRILTEL